MFLQVQGRIQEELETGTAGLHKIPWGSLPKGNRLCLYFRVPFGHCTSQLGVLQCALGSGSGGRSNAKHHWHSGLLLQPQADGWLVVLLASCLSPRHLGKAMVTG